MGSKAPTTHSSSRGAQCLAAGGWEEAWQGREGQALTAVQLHMLLQVFLEVEGLAAGRLGAAEGLLVDVLVLPVVLGQAQGRSAQTAALPSLPARFLTASQLPSTAGLLWSPDTGQPTACHSGASVLFLTSLYGARQPLCTSRSRTSQASSHGEAPPRRLSSLGKASGFTHTAAQPWRGLPGPGVTGAGAQLTA